MGYYCISHGILLHITWDITVYLMGYYCISHGILLYISWDIIAYHMGYYCISHGISCWEKNCGMCHIFITPKRPHYNQEMCKRRLLRLRSETFHIIDLINIHMFVSRLHMFLPQQRWPNSEEYGWIEQTDSLRNGPNSTQQIITKHNSIYPHISWDITLYLMGYCCISHEILLFISWNKPLREKLWDVSYLYHTQTTTL